jgi:hypothetical protein
VELIEKEIQPRPDPVISEWKRGVSSLPHMDYIDLSFLFLVLKKGMLSSVSPFLISKRSCKRIRGGEDGYPQEKKGEQVGRNFERGKLQRIQ